MHQPDAPSGTARDRPRYLRQRHHEGHRVMDLSAIGFVETYTPQHIMLIRLIFAAILGGAIGFERESHAAAGFRTHILIATAACLFTLLAFEIFHLSDVVETGRADPIRTIEAVTAGIAFLGAGAIFQSRGSVQGLTTAAGMWLAGAVGVAVALGYYLIALAVSVLAVIVLAVLRAFTRNKGPDAKGTPDKEES